MPARSRISDGATGHGATATNRFGVSGWYPRRRPASRAASPRGGTLFNLSFTSYIPHLRSFPRSVLVPALLIRPLRVVLGAAGFSALERCTSEWETTCSVGGSSRDKRQLVSRRDGVGIDFVYMIESSRDPSPSAPFRCTLTCSGRQQGADADADTDADEERSRTTHDHAAFARWKRRGVNLSTWPVLDEPSSIASPLGAPC